MKPVVADDMFRFNGSFNDCGPGEDSTFPSPGKSPKQPFPEIGLQDHLYGRQASPNSTHFTRGYCSNMSPS